MRLLLDTHVLLWWLSNDPRLWAAARTAITDPASSVWVSAASAWEIAIKSARGKLQAPRDLEAALRFYGFRRLPISVEHALWVGTLPRLHEDPFDRMLVAQAQVENLVLVTADSRLLAYSVRTLHP